MGGLDATSKEWCRAGPHRCTVDKRSGVPQGYYAPKIRMSFPHKDDTSTTHSGVSTEPFSDAIEENVIPQLSDEEA